MTDFCRRKAASVLVVLVLSSLVAGCGGGGGGGSDDGSGASPRVSVTPFSGSVDAANRVTINFTVAANTNGAQLITFLPDGILLLRSLSGPQGSIPLASLTSGSQSATTQSRVAATLQFPLVGVPLGAGTYAATFDVATSAFRPVPAGTPVRAQLLQKNDSDLSQGKVRVNVLLVGPVAGSEELIEDLTEASERAKSILAQADIALDIEFIGVGGPETIPDPRTGDPFYEQLANIGRPLAVHIAVAGQVLGLDGEEQELSISVLESQPGIPSARSVSAMSIREIAGSDGRFNFRGDGSSQIFEDEIKIAGEEMAQLIGHALGLQHIVELDGSRVVRSDNLGDTPACITFVDCREESAVRENFMFPDLIGVPDGGQRSYSRERITADQAARMQQSPLVD